MSLRILADLVQGTREWDEQRRGMVTSSVIAGLITPKTVKPAANPEQRAIFAQLVAERITDYTEPTYASEDMLRGHEVEPLAAQVYSAHYSREVTTAGFMVRNDWGYEIGYSPDGLVDDDGLIEVKSRRQKKHLATVLADEVPSEHVAQIQCGLLVSGRAWCDYVSYCGGMALWVKRMEPDPIWQAAIVEAVATFETAAQVMTATYLNAVAGMPECERIEMYGEVELKLS